MRTVKKHFAPAKASFSLPEALTVGLENYFKRFLKLS